MRGFVRTHLELDDEELPDSTLNVYLQDAFERTYAASNQWPRQEMTWEISILAGEGSAALPTDMIIPSIMSVLTPQNYRLIQINHENAEDMFAQTPSPVSGTPLYYSIWARRLYVWPMPQNGDVEPYQMNVRGYSQPTWDSSASAIPDIDLRLHIAICYYAMSLVYAAQEDEILEGVYIARWERDVRQQVKQLLEPSMHRPLVMNGGIPASGFQPYVIVPPTEP